jgi:hypothetical protein
VRRKHPPRPQIRTKNEGRLRGSGLCVFENQGFVGVDPCLRRRRDVYAFPSWLRPLRAATTAGEINIAVKLRAISNRAWKPGGLCDGAFRLHHIDRMLPDLRHGYTTSEPLPLGKF